MYNDYELEQKIQPHVLRMGSYGFLCEVANQGFNYAKEHLPEDDDFIKILKDYAPNEEGYIGAYSCYLNEVDFMVRSVSNKSWRNEAIQFMDIYKEVRNRCYAKVQSLEKKQAFKNWLINGNINSPIVLIAILLLLFPAIVFGWQSVITVINDFIF